MLVVEIRVRGNIDGGWSDWLGGLGLRAGEPSPVAPGGSPETTLQGELADQAALYGVLAKLGRLGLDLWYVRCCLSARALALTPGSDHPPRSAPA